MMMSYSCFTFSSLRVNILSRPGRAARSRSRKVSLRWLGIRSSPGISSSTSWMMQSLSLRCSAPRRLDSASRTSAMVPLSSCHLVHRFSVMTLSDALVWGSRSTRRTRFWCSRARYVAILTAQVVFPTPPFMLMNEMTCAFGMEELVNHSTCPGRLRKSSARQICARAP